MPQSEYNPVPVINGDDKKAQENVTILEDTTIEFEETERPVELLYKTKSRLNIPMLVFIVSLSVIMLLFTILFFFLVGAAMVTLVFYAFFFIAAFFLLRPTTLEIHSDRLVIHHLVGKSIVKYSQIKSVTTENSNGGCFSVDEVVLHQMIGNNIELHPRYHSEFASFLRYAMSPGTHLRPTARFEKWESPTIVI